MPACNRSKLCEMCQASKAVIKRPKTLQKMCKECFYAVFELEIHHTIVQGCLFERGSRVAIAASGGKGMWRDGLMMRFHCTGSYHDDVKSTL